MLSAPSSSTTPASPPTSPPNTTSSDDFAVLKEPKVEAILNSELGLAILNDRIKDYLLTCKELAGFFKKRSILEEESGKNLQKLAKSYLETFQSKHHSPQSFSASVITSMEIHEQLANHSLTLQKTLSAFSDQVIEFHKNAERKRKSIKEYAKKQENAYLEAVMQMDKSKSRFKGAETEYNRALDNKNTGDSQKKVGFFKPKSNAQLTKLEDEARLKAENAESDMHSKIENAQNVQKQLLCIHRPNYIKQFFSLQREIESSLIANYLRYTKLCESNTLLNGLTIRPQKPTPTNCGLQHALDNINANTDFVQYVLHASIKHEDNKNPTDASKTKIIQPPSSYGTGSSAGKTNPPVNPTIKVTAAIPSPLQNTNPAPSTFPNPSVASPAFPNSSTSNPSTAPASASPLASTLKPSTANDTNGSSSSSSSNPRTSSPLASNAENKPPVAQQSPPVLLPTLPPIQTTTIQTSREVAPPPSSINSNRAASPFRPTSVSPQPSSPTKSLLFGARLDAIILREHSNIPNIVMQCTSQVENFGLNLQGIYRVPSSSARVNMLRSQFENNPLLQLHTPEDYENDVHAVADLLKIFFRELREPLIPDNHQRDFIDAGNVEDESRRRDAVHRAINDLPDANYSTIRHLTIHLAKIKENSDVNKMSTNNLAIIWGPTIIKQATIPEISSFSRTIEILIDYCFTIFDYD
ncbi:RhoGAP Rga7 [Schizosaccharomyces pombe]|uniref:Probable Rho-GTPase-activating protein 7 n=1 Tax=Schizosaccharomyces pombe (strain 972 / ATCC 24843) TaxID=284812 RepID=RGA7_SCHPO|nr:Rho-type GTPase-activating protein Rga7 [Schizosaccharomyces pombe]O94466.1 RecName: Full=Probable Rho-GTPase-activating protein 7 [Schizosaccharomyces pombe 972h-]CAA22624.1 Rho-type GTPase activating protein Rga7 [Schizosaccharomyces pombe]|eukprot:NP_595866.1 Rho-type GTPase-activating protein Rga7 [Schizosaccharomyces pombe]